MACKYYINNKVLNEQEIKEYISSNYIKESDIKYTTIGDIADLLAYSNSKLILPGYEVEYTTPDNMKFKTYQEASNHISDLAKSVEDVDLESVILPETHWVTWEVMNFRPNVPEDPYDVQYYNKDFINKQEAEKFVETLNQRDNVSNIEIKKTNESHNAKSFIEKNKEYEQSKEIIEEWKKVNNIQYNPEEIYSRGQEFSSVVGAYSSFDVNLMMQNLLSHIEDNEKAGGKFAISAYTKPIDKQIGHLEGGGGKIKFKLYPQSNDILWAANTDVYSGSVWDASEKVNKDKKSELLGVSYTKYPALRNVNSVQPNLASIVDNLEHHHNELGIVLTGNNFRLEYDEDIPYTTKKIIDGINSILDQKYGKLVKPEIRRKKLTKEEFQELKNLQEAQEQSKNLPDFMDETDLFTEKDQKRLIELQSLKGIQPTQTKDNLKESIDSVKKKLNNLTPSQIKELNDKVEAGDITSEEEYNAYIFDNLDKINKKEYISQALINTKIAKLKEVAKKYPRSLIRSEVKRINTSSSQELYDQFGADELPFQKVSKDTQELFDKIMNTPSRVIDEKIKNCL